MKKMSLQAIYFVFVIFFLFHATAQVAGYQHRRISAAVSSLSSLQARKCHFEGSIIHSFLFASYSDRLQSKQQCGRARARALAKRHATLILGHMLCTFSHLMNNRKIFLMWRHIPHGLVGDQPSINATRASKSTID
jgi:hypothetical protein